MARPDHSSQPGRKRPSPQRERFERALKRSGASGPALWRVSRRKTGLKFGSGRLTGSVGAFRPRLVDVLGFEWLLLALAWMLGRLQGLPWRHGLQVAVPSLAAGLAMASTLAVQGYISHPPSWAAQRLADRTGHGLYSQDGALMGALFEPKRGADGQLLDHASFGHVALRDAPPPLYVQLLLALEHQGHFKPWRNLCGSDPLAILKRGLTGAGGGSTLANQMAKQLREPDVRRSRFAPWALVQKLQEMGLACALHLQLGGAEGVLRAFADTAPVAQVAGTSRGLAAGAQVLFGTTPQQASPAELAVLVALVQRPLSLTPPAAFAKGCPTLRAVPPDQVHGLSKTEQYAKSHCHVLARARVGLKQVLPAGPALDAALEQVAGWERTGLQPVDTFETVQANRLVNVSARTRALLGDNLLQQLAAQVDKAAVPEGEPLVLSFSAAEQLVFRKQLDAARLAVDASIAGRELLCVILSPATAPRHCRGVPPGHAQAELVMVRARVADGRITRLHHSTRNAYERHWQMGSLAKLVVLVAALRQGLQPSDLVCPRAASADGRQLRRETRPVHGFSRCGPGELISLAEATGTSDSLAYYELARQIGPVALQAAMQALGLPLSEASGSLPYALAFGTATATPAQLLAMGQAVFAWAHGVQVQVAAPQLLRRAEPDAPTAWIALGRLLPQASQQQALRALLQAPFLAPRGTLATLSGSGATAGKSGTTSSHHVPLPGMRPYQQARLSLTWQPSDQTVALAIVAGNEPQPLGQARLPAEVIQPLRQALLR